MEEFHSVHGEGQTEQIVGEPVLLQQVPDAHAGAQRQANLVRTDCEEKVYI